MFVSVTLEVLNKCVVTDDDRNNPNYTDPCLVSQGILCSYCCVFNLKTCSRDIQACDIVTDRDYDQLSYMIFFIASVVCGCPMIAFILQILINKRFFHVSAHYYQ